MNFPFYIARRYLFSKKKHNAINIISGISVCGVALATLALVCTLSVFNGFQDMVASFFTAFDPQLKITIREGKVFDGQDERIRAVCALPEVSVSTETLEENAMVQYKDDYLYSPGVVFVVNQQKYDESYILTSLDFLRNLLDYTTEVSGIELKLKPNTNISSVQSKIEKMLGDDFVVQNRYQQQADVFRIMEIEKLISYLFLTFILMIACFNVIGSLSMLILDKKDDVITLRSLGASDKLISRIFLFEGRLISLFGAISGIILGLILCFIQQKFGIITLGGGGGTFVVDAYPVSVHAWDVVLIFITVLAVGFLSVWYPVRYLSKRLL